ncbi:uncharacterized protein LOC124912211 [Impatiens glandulifera]|uniref:uncharacterized protein LOC124912211 n=1 Tax=Impatiens glandulifera TaxID=253017 RepID=UPI001FB162C7|nr:uncharacterized protein LOC124912211 [Impatiens glandulifera]
MKKNQTKTNNGVCEKIYKAMSFSPVFRTIRRISFSPTTTVIEVPITSGNPMPATNFRQNASGKLPATEIKQGRKINGGDVEERKEAMGKRVDSLNDRVSNYINRAKLKMRNSSNVNGDN